jgi:ApaG protein
LHVFDIAQNPLRVEIRLVNRVNYVIMRALSDASNGLWVKLDRLVHQPDVLTSPDRPHCFAYFISIHNDGDEKVTIKGRKWVVTESSGDVIVVEGDGVVGEFPTIPPGKHFTYNSFHVIHSNHAKVEGSYLGISENSVPIVVQIPPFELVVPEPEIGCC